MCFILNYMMNSCWNCLLATEVYFGLYEVLQLTEEPPTPPPAALWEYYESIRQRGSGEWKRPEKNGNGEVVSKRGQNNISIIAVFVQTFLLVMTTGVKWVVNAARFFLWKFEISKAAGRVRIKCPLSFWY